MPSTSDPRLRTFMERFQALNRRLASSWEDSGAGRERLSPSDLSQGMARIEAALARYAPAGAADDRATPERDQVTELSELALGLLGELVTLAATLGLDDIGQDARTLSLDLATWTAEQGAMLRVIEPVVEALASEANGSRDPQQLTDLYDRITRVMEAVAPAARKSGNPHRPSRAWRLLLINRAIVATRTLNPGLMESAFDTLVTELPEDAPRFFAEGMGQLDIVGYPPRVREVMTRYYVRFGSTSNTLH